LAPSIALWCALAALPPGSAQARWGAAAPSSCQEVVVSADPDFAPYAWYDGTTMRGAAVGIVRNALQRIGLRYRVVYSGPFSRVLLSARSGLIDIVAELKIRPERETYLRFSRTAIFDNPSAAFVTAGSTLSYQQWDDLIPLQVGATRGTVFGGGLDEFLAERVQVDVGPGIAENFEKLARGRIQVFVSPYYPAQTYLRESGQESRFRALKPFVSTATTHVGWSKVSPCLDWLPALDEQLSIMARDGEIERTIATSIQEWRLAPPGR
jgi:polar amino acid transport system substrate-binding protein